MIIYPAIIILILLVCFFVVWRRAYFVQAGGVYDDVVKSEDRPKLSEDLEEKGHSKKTSFSFFNKKKEEPDILTEKSQDPLMEKAEELFFIN